MSDDASHPSSSSASSTAPPAVPAEPAPARKKAAAAKKKAAKPAAVALKKTAATKKKAAKPKAKVPVVVSDAAAAAETAGDAAGPAKKKRGNKGTRRVKRDGLLLKYTSNIGAQIMDAQKNSTEFVIGATAFKRVVRAAILKHLPEALKKHKIQVRPSAYAVFQTGAEAAVHQMLLAARTVSDNTGHKMLMQRDVDAAVVAILFGRGSEWPKSVPKYVKPKKAAAAAEPTTDA